MRQVIIRRREVIAYPTVRRPSPDHVEPLLLAARHTPHWPWGCGVITEREEGGRGCEGQHVGPWRCGAITEASSQCIHNHTRCVVVLVRPYACHLQGGQQTCPCLNRPYACPLQGGQQTCPCLNRQYACPLQGAPMTCGSMPTISTSKRCDGNQKKG